MAALALVFWGSQANAELVYFEEDGGSGNPRGLYNFDLQTNESTLRATVGGSERFFSMAMRPSDGTVFAIDADSRLHTIDTDTGATSLVAETGLPAENAFGSAGASPSRSACSRPGSSS